MYIIHVSFSVFDEYMYDNVSVEFHSLSEFWTGDQHLALESKDKLVRCCFEFFVHALVNLVYAGERGAPAAGCEADGHDGPLTAGQAAVLEDLVRTRSCGSGRP